MLPLICWRARACVCVCLCVFLGSNNSKFAANDVKQINRIKNQKPKEQQQQ